MPLTFTDAVFPRLQPKTEETPQTAAPKEAAQAKEAQAAAGEGLLDISEFGKVQLRVAQVLQAERVEGADRLLKLQISLGEESRQIVAGVAEHYSPEQITGMRIVVVANLKPAKIRGLESRGMLLAAKQGKTLKLVVPDGDIPPGATIG